MQANNLNLSLHSLTLVYCVLALYGMLTLAILAYVRMRFRDAAKGLKMLKTEWDSAESLHAGFVGKAQEQISRLAAPAPALPKRPALSFDVHEHVVAMAKKGFTPGDIAKSCSLQEGEVDVLLGMARLAPR